jgi:signal peptidase
LHIVAGLAMAVLIVALLAGTLPTLLGYESYVVSSASMEPALRVDDIAVVQPFKASELRAGDVITYRTPNQPALIITERLQSVQTDPSRHLSFQTRGDANATPDKVDVEQAAVLGKLVFSIPKLGILIDFSKRTEGHVALLVVPGLLLLLEFIRGRIGRGRKAFVEMQGRPAPDAARILALLEGGQRAMQAGHGQLATRAADGVLQLDPRSQDAWILKAQATGDTLTATALLQTALVVNPGAPKLAAALRALQPQQEHAKAA